MATRASRQVLHRQDVGFRAVIMGAQSVAQNTVTKISFSIEQLDYGNNLASSSFTAPVKGLYQFTASCCILIATNADCSGFFYINGAQKSRPYNGLQAYPNATATDLLELYPGDVVDYRVISRSAAASIEDNNVTGFFAGCLVREVA